MTNEENKKRKSGIKLSLNKDKTYSNEWSVGIVESRLSNWKDYLKYFKITETQIEYNENINGLMVDESWFDGLKEAIKKSGSNYLPNNIHLTKESV